MDPNHVLVTNLIAALQQLDRYVIIGLFTSVSALALTGKAAAQDRIQIPYTNVKVVSDIACLMLIAVCFLVGAMASYAVESANLIAERLHSAPMLLEAACTYPSIATSPYIVVRILAALLPFVFSMIAIVRSVRPYSKDSLWAILGFFFFLALAYGTLTLMLVKSKCLANLSLPY